MTATTDAPGNRVVRKIRIRAVGFLAAALLAGIAAVLLVKVYLDQARRRSAAAPVETVPVVVAVTDIAVGQRVTPDQVTVVRWPADHAPAASYRQATDVVGHTARQALVPGEALLPDRLAGQGQGHGLAAILDAGARAMAVKVDQVIGIAGFVQPGDHVDVITTLTPDDETKAVLHSQAARMSKIILQDIRVLAVGEHLSTEGRKPVKVQVVTLEVQPEESERLALASQHGTIQLTMRSRADRDAVATEGVTPLLLLAGERPPDTSVAAAEPAQRPEVRRTRRTLRERREAVRAPEPRAETKPPAPVVEILRGTSKIEERKLRPVGGEP